jgi:2',3'-cyclic-nucleotide 2'-phosphodiesterase (5'-nucleotidase family)
MNPKPVEVTMMFQKFTVLFLVHLLIIFLGSAAAQTDTLTIIHVNDTHSNLLPYGGPQYGGISRAASMIGLWKMTEPNPIFLHNGDFMVGTLMFNAYFGVAELQILQQLGCDALVLGNHEFDGGPTDLGNILASAQLDSNFDILCSNALNTGAVPGLDSVIRTYAIEQRGNMKVGIFGLTTPTANVISNPAPVFIDTNIVQIAMQCITELAGQGCNVILMSSHLGLQLDRMMAQYLTGLDAIIGGHTHDILANPEIINGIPIVQAGEFYHYVGKLRLTFDGNNTSLLDYTLQTIDSSIPSDPGLDALLLTLQMGITAQYTPVIGDPYQQITYAPRHFNAYPAALDTFDTPVGNLFTEAMHNYWPTADCALEPSGHIVEEIYAGPVTAADLFRCYPYGYDSRDGLGFRIASFDLLGTDIYMVLGGLLLNVHPLEEDYDYLIQSHGLDYTAYFNPADNQLYLTSASIAGIPVIPDSSYRVVSSDRVVGYLQSLFGITPGNLVIDTVSVFQVVKEYVEEIDTLNFTSNGHILVGIENQKPENVVLSFELLQNYPNPFNPTTVISWQSATGNNVQLKIFNILGQEVRTLVDHYQEAGNHSVTWDGRNDAGQLVGSGIYFYQIVAGQNQCTRKMMLMR